MSGNEGVMSNETQCFLMQVQAVEESFLLLIATERSKALNILQSSLNKLLSFIGDGAVCTVTASASYPSGADHCGGQFVRPQDNGHRLLPQQPQCNGVSSDHVDSQVSGSNSF